MDRSKENGIEQAGERRGDNACRLIEFALWHNLICLRFERR
jgi:hypothetical protein